jgi:hypothetical protein
MRNFPDEKLGETCGDGGTCHHQCGDRCFRRDGCSPLRISGISMEDWSYLDTQAYLSRPADLDASQHLLSEQQS